MRALNGTLESRTASNLHCSPAMSSSPSSPNVPHFYGFVETTLHALRLIHAARHGVIPRITRRLNDDERRSMVRSGAVFVFGVEESGIKRWTDGLLWSPSRVAGNFLIYREVNERNIRTRTYKKSYPADDASLPGSGHSGHRSLGFKGLSRCDHRIFKLDGLIKKTITVTIDHSELHLISYYTFDDVRSGKLKTPESRSDVMALQMPPSILRLASSRNPPKVNIGVAKNRRLVCESEEMEPKGIKAEEATFHGNNRSTSAVPMFGNVDTFTAHGSRLNNTAGSQYNMNSAPPPEIRSQAGPQWQALTVTGHPISATRRAASVPMLGNISTLNANGATFNNSQGSQHNITLQSGAVQVTAITVVMTSRCSGPWQA